MKKLILIALALSVPAYTLAQTSTTMNFSSGQVKDAAGNVVCQNVAGMTIMGSTITLAGATCGTTTQSKTTTVTVTFPSATYVSGNPVVSWVSDGATPVTCTVTQGGTATLAQTLGNNSVSFAAPTAQGIYSFSLNCTPADSTYTVIYSPGNSSSMTVGGNGTGGGDIDTCDSTQVSDLLGTVRLTRQCTGSLQYHGTNATFAPKPDYQGDLKDLSKLLSGGSTRNFMALLSGAPMVMAANSGSYIALGIKIAEPGSLQFAANPSYGGGNIVSLSTRPGGLVAGQPGVICSQNSGGANGIYISTDPGSLCPIEVGQTYWINFADADYNGNLFCSPGGGVGCSTTKISYTEMVSRR